MYKIEAWRPDLNLEEFYSIATSKGFTNNASQHMLIDCFASEREKQVWILYYNNRAVGSVAAHSFDDIMGPNSYRIAARACIFTDMVGEPYRNVLRTITGITTHQNLTSQFLIPTCIDWAPKDANLYITSNESAVGSQRRVHNIFGPALEKTGILKRIKDTYYRGTIQTIWQLFPGRFYEELSIHKRWKYD